MNYNEQKYRRLLAKSRLKTLIKKISGNKKATSFRGGFSYAKKIIEAAIQAQLQILHCLLSLCKDLLLRYIRLLP
jgi:hypothetical protein